MRLSIRERRNSFSPKWIGIALITCIIISLLTRSIEYIVSRRALTYGKIDSLQYNMFLNTTFYSMFYLMNLVIVGLLIVYFFFNRNQEKSRKEHRIGFTTSLITLGLQIVTIILYILAEVRKYNFLFRLGILKSQLFFNISFFVSYFIVLVIYWKIIFASKSVSSSTTFLSFSLLAFGLCVFLIAMDQILMFLILGYHSTGLALTYTFFDYAFKIFYSVFAVIAGTTIIQVSQQKDDLV
ncbi:MAG: hypothetical protein HGN29_14810 [Asgard group archaeon]|nr:hypothetical protein [Asgard group archaeon]